MLGHLELIDVRSVRILAIFISVRTNKCVETADIIADVQYRIFM